MTTQHIDRRCHYLRRNKSSKRPSLLLFVDVESFENAQTDHASIQTFRCGWACLARYVPYQGLKTLGWYKIEDPLEFWHVVSSLASDNKCTYLISHNIDYDARILHAFSILPGIGWTPAYAILGESCRFFTFKADKNTIALLDNLNYWRLPLADIGSEFGIEKTSIDFKTATTEELSVYCKNDVRILVKLWDYWLRFLDEHHLGDFAITVAGQAFRAFRHRFMGHKIGIHNREDAVKLERASYKGGRCAVFKTGKFNDGPYYKLDINGLYAYVMREYSVPRKLVKVLVDVSPGYLAKLLDRYQVVVDCIVETQDPVYALHSKGYNIFPVGTFRVTLTTPEIVYALDHNHLRAIGQVAIYEHDILFRKFIDYFTPLRQQYKKSGDTGRSAMCKLIRNSLYGKFGQRGYEQEIIGKAPLDQVSVRHWVDLESEAECWDWTFGGVVLRQQKKGEAPDSFPGIAAHIAAQGRLVLWDYVQKAGEKNVFYVDTDSLIVNQTGYKALQPWVDALELGCLKLEGKTTNLEILAKKSYVFGDKRVSKGIRKNATLQADGAWRQVHFTSLKWAFQQGNLDDVTVHNIEKHVANTITHGKVNRDGSVSPPQFSLKRNTVSQILEPKDAYSWDWWVSPSWLQRL